MRNTGRTSVRRVSDPSATLSEGERAAGTPLARTNQVVPLATLDQVQDTPRFDHIDAIAAGITSLGFNIGESFERRAKASFIEQALKLAGYRIIPNA